MFYNNFGKLVARRSYSTIKPVKLNFNVFESPDTNKNLAPVIIMHGLFGSNKNWRGVARALESKIKRRIFTVDARNHGESPHTTEHSSAHMAADIVELMRQERIKKAFVMGHSMGGRAMMYLALKYPEIVDRGVIVDISPLTMPNNFLAMEQIFAAMKNIAVPSNLSMAEGRLVVEQQMKSAVGSQETVDFIMLNLRKRISGEFYWAPNVDALSTNMRDFTVFMDNINGLAPFQNPILFICGNRSNYVDPDSWPTIQTIFPNSKLHWLDAGHLVHFEQPSQFIDLVINFLK